eukprot:CAMPEP_0115832750 /NCGR_PEP_ID=MMETSP0287-20121206/2819_1 /TAXON_ID=412157 /ORGANISM="Chrysochromulina rotalis, Strain UIO044" /LENGTH=153 /DNA_ID=CAMNT_0003286145 /DNA_START=87 /DNA_END=548 /DNA_ORIENTATION=+
MTRTPRARARRTTSRSTSNRGKSNARAAAMLGSSSVAVDRNELVCTVGRSSTDVLRLSCAHRERTIRRRPLPNSSKRAMRSPNSLPSHATVSFGGLLGSKRLEWRNKVQRECGNARNMVASCSTGAECTAYAMAPCGANDAHLRSPADRERDS